MKRVQFFYDHRLGKETKKIVLVVIYSHEMVQYNNNNVSNEILLDRFKCKKKNSYEKKNTTTNMKII